MGQFSWLDCKSGKQIIDNQFKDVFLLVPERFGGGHITEHCYDGYGHFGGEDVYALLARWNSPRKCNGDDEHDRLIGIEQHFDERKRAKYTIKVTYDPNAKYEDCDESPDDPNQGWAEEDEDEFNFYTC